MPQSLELLQKNWDGLAAFDARWAILAYADKKGGRWREEEFFETGKREIDEVMATLQSLDLPPRRRAALDFGCGVGRLTRALAQRFDQASGVDISRNMIRQAAEGNDVPRNCRFLLNQRPDLAQFDNGAFDFVYSSIVLQHMRLPASEAYIREFCRVLAPGGIMVFQMPHRPVRSVKGAIMCLLNTAALRPIWNMYRRLKHWNLHVMEMHGIAPLRLFELLSAEGVALRYMVQEHSAGKDWISYRYFCSKPEASDEAA